MAWDAGAIVSKLTLDRSKFSASIKAVQKQTKSLGGWVKKNSGQFKAMGIAAVAAGTAALVVFKKMVTQFVETGDMIHKMALRTGFAAETLSELAYAADISGADITMLEKGVKKMSKTIVDASYGLETYLRVFRSLGLDVEDLMKLTPEEQFLKIGAAIAAMESDTLRTAAAVDVLGRAGTMLLPLFAEGAEGIAKLREEAHTLGIIFDEEAAAKAAALKDAQTALTGSVKGLSIAILTDLIPVLTDVTKAFTDFFVDSRKNANTWATSIISFMELIAKGAMKLLAGLQILQSAVFEMAAGVAGYFRTYIENLIVGFAVLAKIGVPVKGILNDLLKAWVDLGAVEKGYTEQMDKHIEQAADIIAGFSEFFKKLQNISVGLKDAKKDTESLGGAITESLLPSVMEVSKAWEGLIGDSKELTLAWEQDMLGMEESTLNFMATIIPGMAFMTESYTETIEKIVTQNELLMESWGLTTEAQLTFTQVALAEFMAMEASLKGFVGAILNTLEQWAIGQIIPKIMAALPFPLNLLATGGAILAIKTIFKSIRGMEEGGMVEREGLYHLHAGEEVRPAEVARAPAGVTKTGPGPFHTEIYLTINAQRLDDRTINEAAEKIHAAINRQIRRY